MKKGVSQIDWIVSLALFLMYITWFFVFISPQVNFQDNQDSTITYLKDDFFNEFKWQLKKTPIFVESNHTGMVPVIMENVFLSDNLRFADDTNHIVWKDDLIFLANLSGETKIYEILEGVSYTQTYNYKGISTDSNSASVKNASFNFENSLLNYAQYNGDERIKDIDYFINGDRMNPNASDYDTYGFVVFYNSHLGNINHTTFLFDENSQSYARLSSPPGFNYSIILQIDLYDYDSYYSDNNNFGDFTYGNDSTQISYSHSKITFFGSDSLTLFFDGTANFNITNFNSTLTVIVEFDVFDDYMYEFLFHSEGQDKQRLSAVANIGSSKEIEGIYLDNISTNYLYLKDKWGIESNFYIGIYENSSELITDPEYEIGNFVPDRKRVYAETQNTYALANNGGFTPISVNYRIW
ncbi:hypothetical protein HN789_04035 [archaeon]|jgi:hypothetical protein|nr:hypothetical protein [archaeon]MBT4022507.1 hypothetical protein [archaeon]MBT4272346.1 hypothetical protein [archaeon]MBT4460455.1 hypothetical protein [archaeon]MBT4858474.1 hypothetical protein [archaeon]